MLDNIIAKNKDFIDFLGLTLGPDYEIALYDMSLDPPSIVAIINGSISGRSIGAPLSTAVREMVQNQTYLKQDWVTNYCGITPSGKKLRCSTFFIKGDQQQLLGLLTVSFDDSRYQNMQEILLSLCHPRQYVNQTVPSGSMGTAVSDTLHNNISQAIEDALTTTEPADKDHLTRSERTRVIRLLDQKGIFRLKGAVPLVAGRLSCSVASVYRYLGEIHQSYE